ncbi:MAG: methyltransferase domain-containing protein [Patescibacteria group bacterium]
MDGFPKKKNKEYAGKLYSETRFYLIQWLEQEIPKVSGDIINISAGGWDVPYSLLNKSKIKSYITFDKPLYGDSKNKVNIFGDVHAMPKDWNDKWDCIINNQAIECYENPFKAMDEMYRILKPGGILLIDAPYNYRFFGDGTGLPKRQNPVKDYWRITRDGWQLLTKQFSSSNIKGFGGSGEEDRFVYCIKAIK